MNDFISIITVNYNGSKFLRTFLDSVKNLDYPPEGYEITVVDNASEDGSVSFIRKNYANVKVITLVKISPKNTVKDTFDNRIYLFLGLIGK